MKDTTKAFIKGNFIEICLGMIAVELLIVIWCFYLLLHGLKWGFSVV